MGSADLGDLVTALLDGPFETPLWKTFLDRIRLATNADVAVLIFQPPGMPPDEAYQLTSGPVTLTESNEMYRRHFFRNGAIHGGRTPEGIPCSMHDLLELDEGTHASFYEGLVELKGISAVLTMRVEEASGIDAWLTIARHGDDFGKRESGLLVQIAPYLRGMFRNYIAREHDRFTAALTADAVSRLQFGWLALDQAGQVLASDQFGERLLSQSGVISRNRFGRLSVKPQQLEREILDAIGKIAADPQSRPRAIPLRSDPWLDMLLVPTREKSLLTTAAPVVIAYVHGDNWRSTDRCGQLIDLFSLSPSEARLALALCRGKSIAEAGEELKLTLETARSYSKSIYAKTGSRGLPDLVRIIMGSVLALAPEPVSELIRNN